MDRIRFQQEIGERISDRRKELGLYQKDLGEAIGVSQSDVCFWENGQRLIPLKYLSTLAETLGASMAYILGEETLAQMLNRQDAADEVRILRERLAEKDSIIRSLMRGRS